MEGLRGFSPIVHVPAESPRFGSAQVVQGDARISVPIYVPFYVDALDYIIGDLPDDSYHWRIQGDDEMSTGRLYNNSGFRTIGERTLELYVRDGENDYVARNIIIDVILPSLSIDSHLFDNQRIISVQSDPAVANVPIGIVGERDDVKDWVLNDPVGGSGHGEK